MSFKLLQLYKCIEKMFNWFLGQIITSVLFAFARLEKTPVLRRSESSRQM